MRNDKVIIISGFARGGTNIAWNILQSHPGIVAPLHETGELIRKSRLLRLCIKSKWFGKSFFGPSAADWVLFRHKMESLVHPDNRYINEGVLYSREQMGEAALCLKSVNDDIFLTDALRVMYPNLYFIFLARSGYALCEGHLRRGFEAGDYGRLYQRVADKVKQLSSSLPNFCLIKFEDMIASPFDVAGMMFEFLGMKQTRLLQIRLKSKKIVSPDGVHRTIFGIENRKYWFSPESIHEVLKFDINRVQLDRLDAKSRNSFEVEAGSALEFFGYFPLD